MPFVCWFVHSFLPLNPLYSPPRSALHAESAAQRAQFLRAAIVAGAHGPAPPLCRHPAPQPARTQLLALLLTVHVHVPLHVPGLLPGRCNAGTGQRGSARTGGVGDAEHK
jgi:hypothetical protein